MCPELRYFTLEIQSMQYQELYFYILWHLNFIGAYVKRVRDTQ